MRLIGIDCSTNSKNIGIALADWDGTASVRKLHAGVPNPWSTVSDWVKEPDSRDTLVAIDAPLGWPRPLAPTIAHHTAGSPVTVCPNSLFRRTTDRYIYKQTGKRPLDVGADRIARTAAAALSGLEYLRTEAESRIPLARHHEGVRGTQAIEVYPAATLKVHGLPCDGYKKKKIEDHREKREEILHGLPNIEVPCSCQHTARSNADALDALVCLLAAVDFLTGHAMPPQDCDLARTEGWIWCRAPDGKPD